VLIDDILAITMDVTMDIRLPALWAGFEYHDFEP